MKDTADYKESEAKAVEALKKAIPSSLKKNMLPISKGMSAEIYENNEIFPNHYLACAIDSTGTKAILAEAMHKFDTIGIDCVAMSANDLATFAHMSPFLFMDCLSCQNKIQEEAITAEIIKGISDGLKQCDASSILRNSTSLNFGKGETASVHELLSSARPGYGFDLVGSMIGFMPKKSLNITAKEGDCIIALPSSGPHSNGYTALRHHLLNGDFELRSSYKKHYKGKYSLTDEFEGKTIGDHLIEPTKLYVKGMAKASTITDNLIAVNNTGYGLKNLNRIPGDFTFIINKPLKPPPILNLMQQESGYSDEEMYTTFNMGMGFFIIAPKEHEAGILKAVKDAKTVGYLKKATKKSTVLIKANKEIEFKGY